jgi:hypothetical protein
MGVKCLKREFPSMKTLVFGLLAGIVGFIVAYYIFGENGEQPNPQSEFLSVYVVDPQVRNVVNPDKLYYVKIPSSVPLLYKMQMLADTISRLQFGRRPITVMEIENRNNKSIAIVNLNDYESQSDKYPTWKDVFQDPASGLPAIVTFSKSLLQEDYQGEWIDGVEFLYNGEPFPEELDSGLFSDTLMR